MRRVSARSSRKETNGNREETEAFAKHISGGFQDLGWGLYQERLVLLLWDSGITTGIIVQFTAGICS